MDSAPSSSSSAAPPAPLDPQVTACIAALTEWRASPALQASLSPAARAFLEEPTTLRRYAVARNGKADAAQAALQATLAWREAFMAPPLGCTQCPTDPFTHCFHTVGLAAPTPAAPAGSVLVYACAARAKQNESADAVRHMVHTLEHAWAAPGVTADRLRALGWESGAVGARRPAHNSPLSHRPSPLPPTPPPLQFG